MPDELKDCAFCNGPAVFVKHAAGMPGTMGWDAWHAVECKACGATIGAYDRRFRDNDQAAKVWNTRATPAQAPAVTYTDPLQGAADWLKNGLLDVSVTDIQSRLLIGYNRARRLFDGAHAAAVPESPAARDVLAERRRQISAEDWTPAQAVGAWQDIATAPKDQTHLLLATVDDCEVSYGHVIEGWWQDGWGDAPDDMGCDDGWTSCDFYTFRPGRSFGAKDYQHAGMQPTHWQPMPRPPVAVPSKNSPGTPAEAAHALKAKIDAGNTQPQNPIYATNTGARDD